MRSIDLESERQMAFYKNLNVHFRGFIAQHSYFSQAELESIPLSYITQTKSLEDNGSDDNSLLIITVQDRNKRVPQVFMFQCEETSVSLIFQ